jgi:predicted amidohydrolase
MKIVLCQTPIIWESPIENLAYCSQVLNDIFKNKNSGIDVIVFPEFFTYGFTMNPNIAENPDGMSTTWLRNKSKEFCVAITATVPIKEGDKLFNRAFFVTPDGDEYIYNKRHLFSYGGEDVVFSGGTSQCIFNYKGWNILLQICYDIRFPVWSRNKDLLYDLIINMANWPSTRENVVEPLTKARAIENLCYYAFNNRIGCDLTNNYNRIGFVSDYKGDVLDSVLGSNEFNYKTYELNIDSLKLFREKFKVWKDADKFNLIF